MISVVVYVALNSLACVDGAKVSFFKVHPVVFFSLFNRKIMLYL